ncbi:MAG: recombinase family protein, partial [Bacillota bacterium]|nr:recombinase family protein [Bacillota bacterium]
MTGKRQKVAIYARVSGEEQREAGTIENQLEFARRYCDLHGIKVADTYRDDGVTGTVPLERRPEGRRLLKDAADGQFGTVLVYRVDRLARKTIHLLNAYEQLDALGIALRSMTESFDTVTPAGKFTMTMFAS